MKTLFTSLVVTMFAACSSARAPAARDDPPAQAPAAPQETTVAAATSAKVTRVEPSLVCMVNNQFMGKPQIPIAVDGKMYFGCCENCKAQLAQDAIVRTAIDPLSGATVDKATAVIGKDASGAVLYFENESNLQQYATR